MVDKHRGTAEYAWDLGYTRRLGSVGTIYDRMTGCEKGIDGAKQGVVLCSHALLMLCAISCVGRPYWAATCLLPVATIELPCCRQGAFTAERLSFIACHTTPYVSRR